MTRRCVDWHCMQSRMVSEFGVTITHLRCSWKRVRWRRRKIAIFSILLPHIFPSGMFSWLSYQGIRCFTSTISIHRPIIIWGRHWVHPVWIRNDCSLHLKLGKPWTTTLTTFATTATTAAPQATRCYDQKNDGAKYHNADKHLVGKIAQMIVIAGLA